MQTSSISAYGSLVASMRSGSLKKPQDGSSAGSAQSVSGMLGDNSVEQQFLKYAQMSPMDRMRANILKSMGLSEEDLKNMTPEQQKAVEQKIKDLIEQQFEKNAGKAGQTVDISA
ncbi:hypothetical protein JQ633_29675 [Bradyrhizobium tropiciagri]|uniref:hypothetical protein n=1 Tax=Bradyrhizobium tropiciagri TaxID=312253 RepID=UPI001BAC1E98|nr:hypothetical protein [Bradyrhizobium tropiciagri]MBR0874560.1 hypothetical protein [Bradyrhizobium tropiciagri]